MVEFVYLQLNRTLTEMDLINPCVPVIGEFDTVSTNSLQWAMGGQVVAFTINSPDPRYYFLSSKSSNPTL